MEIIDQQTVSSNLFKNHDFLMLFKEMLKVCWTGVGEPVPQSILELHFTISLSHASNWKHEIKL